MSEPRIKGQEVEVILINNGIVADTITDVRSFEIAAKLEIKEEGYLGEKTNRYDEIFNGMRGRIEFHFENDDVFDLLTSIVDRAKRRVPGVQINVKATFNFPNGDRPRVLVPNVVFGEIPINTGSRGDYVTFGVEFAAEDFQVL